MSHLKALKSASTLHDVAALLDFSPSALAYVLYVKSPASKYKEFTIPKKNGGSRTILAPDTDLKLLQKKLSIILQNCADEIREKHGHSDAGEHPDRLSHGFRRNRSIITNATEHRGRRHVLNIDLHDFFGTINFGRVRGLFLKDRNFLLNEKVATILSQISCHNGSLPQGSPCSPVIANLIGHIIDLNVSRLAQRNGATYTRYADDITISTNKKAFPKDIAYRIDEVTHKWELGDRLENEIKRSGFTVNPTKTRMQYADSRQEVTGLIVNKKVNIRPEYRHLVRAMVHKLFTSGFFETEKLILDASGKYKTEKKPGKISQLHGMLGFIEGIDAYNRKIHPNSDAPLTNPTSKEQSFKKFLLYKEFYAAEKPVVLCEGKTDNVYLVHAIRAMAAAFPKLAKVEPKGKIALLIRLFKSSGTSTGRILGLNGGVGDLRNFILSYRENLKKFKAPGLKHPVVILIDNDSGTKPIYGLIAELKKSKPTGCEPFIHLYGNLYVLATPHPIGAAISKIEDFFDTATKSILYKGKSFDDSNDHETSTHYGKADFAYHVVRPNADTINFSGFDQLLKNLSSLIEHHSKMHSVGP